MFDERVLTVLNDGELKFFAQLDAAGFSRNTLKLPVRRLVALSLVVKEKTLKNGMGNTPIR